MNLNTYILSTKLSLKGCFNFQVMTNSQKPSFHFSQIPAIVEIYNTKYKYGSSEKELIHKGRGAASRPVSKEQPRMV